MCAARRTQVRLFSFFFHLFCYLVGWWCPNHRFQTFCHVSQPEMTRPVLVGQAFKESTFPRKLTCRTPLKHKILWTDFNNNPLLWSSFSKSLSLFTLEQVGKPFTKWLLSRAQFTQKRARATHPVAVVEDDRVRRRQVDAQPASPGAEQEDKLVRVSSLVLRHLHKNAQSLICPPSRTPLHFLSTFYASQETSTENSDLTIGTCEVLNEVLRSLPNFQK